MTNASGIRRYTTEELEARRAGRDSQSDLPLLRAKSEAELERDIADDPDFRDIPTDWHAAAEAVMPASKKLLSLRLDTDIVDWFRKQGPGYQTRINAVLRAFVERSGKRTPT